MHGSFFPKDIRDRFPCPLVLGKQEQNYSGNNSFKNFYFEMIKLFNGFLAVIQNRKGHTLVILMDKPLIHKDD